MRSLTYVVAVTTDGFSCGPDGSFDFFALEPDVSAYLTAEYPETFPTHVRHQLGLDAAPNRRFDTLLQGRGSYQVALDAGITSPYAHLRQYVPSRTLSPELDPAVTIVATDAGELVRALKREESQLGICLITGPTMAGGLLPEIDELVVKRYPVVAGAGKPMIDGDFAPARFERVDTQEFDSGADITRYRRI